jgi:hypothetical protein
MPAVEIADSIVQSGRETLEKVPVSPRKARRLSLQEFRLLI